MSEINLTGKRFGQLRVKIWSIGGWLCLCDCGKQRSFYTHALLRGNNTSCGCASKETRKRERHGYSAMPEYQIWSRIVQRCTNPKDKDYPLYGGRGITIHEPWKSSFSEFHRHIKDRPRRGLSINRIDNERGYEPGNIEWSTATNQARNKRNNKRYFYRGENLTIREIHEIYGRADVRLECFHSRVRNYGWSVEKALKTPVRRAA